jgi:hypothetical protein
MTINTQPALVTACVLLLLYRLGPNDLHIGSEPYWVLFCNAEPMLALKDITRD